MAACAEPGEPVTSRVEVVGWWIQPPRQLDVLFVVDNSPAMASHDARWRQNQRDMMNVLSSMEGSLPSVHVGVVTTDLGTLGHDGQQGPAVSGCMGRGDAGRMRPGRELVAGSFLSDIKLADETRERNYVSTLGDAFAELADVGTQGCAYVQPFEAMKLALTSPSNPGFMRDDAYLFVVFVTPNDDCSFAHGGFAIESTAVNAHECITRASELVDVGEYERILRGLKRDPSKIILGAIAGPSEPYLLESGPDGWHVSPSCSAGEASALPAVRVRSLLDRFPDRSSQTTICQQNWSDGLYTFASLGQPVANPCFAHRPIDHEPMIAGIQAQCSVAFRYADGREELVEDCDEGSSLPCWRIEEDPLRCSAPPLALKVLPAPVRIDQRVSVAAQCLVE